MDDKKLNGTLNEYVSSTENSREKILGGVRLEKRAQKSKPSRTALIVFASALCSILLIFCIAFPIAVYGDIFQSNGDTPNYDAFYHGIGEKEYYSENVQSLDEFSTKYGITAFIPTRTEAEGDFWYSFKYYYSKKDEEAKYANIHYYIYDETVIDICLYVLPKNVARPSTFFNPTILNSTTTWRDYTVAYYEQYDDVNGWLDTFALFEDDDYYYYISTHIDPPFTVTEMLDWLYA